MGDPFDEGYEADGERPVHGVTLSPFLLDRTAVTNAQFATFVKATGYVTEAEQLGLSSVFHLAVAASRTDVLGRANGTPWWLIVRGADWRHPAGPLSGIGELPRHPVVHVSWHDANAYARWAGKRLPTEAEWEYAARGGLAGARFPWGDELTPRGRWRLNIWQGRFPAHNTLDDGHLTTAPVTTYPPNGHGLHEMAGNVWEWCADRFFPTTYADRAGTLVANPIASGSDLTGGSVPRVMRGGSFLCHDSYCNRYRVAARSSNTAESASANIGFRCANDARTSEV
jgi:formylglycine-generating enzyme required for sulfatase activity